MNLQEVLKTYWGYDSFRPLQEDIIRSVLAKKDTLALLPTGGGKSICFQVPTMVSEGICIVVSPLIALMKDQVNNLQNKGIKAAAIYSGMRPREIDIVLDNCIYGGYKFLYIAPERLETELFIERVKKMNVNLLAIDEAHCISQWGYDFRPAYIKIANVREILPDVTILALTATATDKVKTDIQQQLLFKKDAVVFQQSFERKNLSYSVLYDEDREGKLKEIFIKIKGSGLVYVRTRRETKRLSDLLKKYKFSADFYHAGLDVSIRMKKQEKWIKGQTRIMVCTNAFGMGIDKPDVRVVIHWDIPESLEAYYQEAGRAGRDEKKSYAVLLYRKADKKKLLELHEKSFPEIKLIKKVYQAIGNYLQLAVGSGQDISYDFNLADFCGNYNMNVAETYAAMKVLEQNEYITLTDNIYSPSRIKVIVGKEDLYKFEVANRKFEPLIQLILRTYGGVYDEYVNINESVLAGKLKMEKKEVEKTLEYFERSNLIFYEKQTSIPRLTYLKPRADEKNLIINEKYLKERKVILQDKLQAVIDYVERIDRCRSGMLLAYFGENNTKNCGQCDVCLGRNNIVLSEKKFNEIYTEIKKLTDSKSIFSKNELIIYLKKYRKTDVLKTVRWLQDQGLIQELEDKKGQWKVR